VQVVGSAYFPFLGVTCPNRVSRYSAGPSRTLRGDAKRDYLRTASVIVPRAVPRQLAVACDTLACSVLFYKPTPWLSDYYRVNTYSRSLFMFKARWSLNQAFQDKIASKTIFGGCSSLIQLLATCRDKSLNPYCVFRYGFLLQTHLSRYIVTIL
jgi:hypothetical protein